MEELAGLPDRMAALELQIVQFRADFRAEFSAFRQEMATKADLEQLRTEMREGDEETRRLMRVLHEEVLSADSAPRGGSPGASTQHGSSTEAIEPPPPPHKKTITPPLT